MNLPPALNKFSLNPAQNQQLQTTLRGSMWCENTFTQFPELLPQLLGQTGSTLEVSNDCRFEQLQNFLDVHLDTKSDPNEFDLALRRCRRYFMCYIIWRDLNRLASMEETCLNLSWFAELCIQKSLDKHYELLSAELGSPQSSNGEKQGLLVLGMGKLGARELNLSSDIDLIFCFPEGGQTNHAKKALSNQEFFSRLGKKIIQSLDAQTPEGRVFRVDMRLRPYGNSGALVSSFAALEQYYQTQGREWERYAMVKARVVANNTSVIKARQLTQLLRSFTYRKYIDFSVIDALRSLKERINQEVQRRGLNNNIKLGAGGIREIEFIAQIFQLIRGGRDTKLQDNRLKYILPELESMGCLPEDMSAELWGAYEFLRNTEHALQAWKDEQTQNLPLADDERKRLAQVMGYKNWDDFFLQLEAHRHLVNAEFQELIAPLESKTSDSPESLKEFASLWLDDMDKEHAIELFTSQKHEDPERSYTLIHELQHASVVIKLHASGRKRLDSFIPLLLKELTNCAMPSETLARIMKLIYAVVRRSAYLLLLVENPLALSQLVKLSVASPWIADQVANHPALLDELLDQRALYSPPQLAELRDELHQHMLRIPQEDLEAQMEALRYFRSSHALRVAACEITNTLPLMKVSDYLTWLAEVVIEYVMQLAWQEMTSKHGFPDGKQSSLQFAILGYGKLGGIELGHGSDLDLVFLYNAKPSSQTSGNSLGKRQLENTVFYMRLGQKIIHILSTNTVSGQLYEVDMRLRPSGNSGMLVTSLAAFEKYQRESAWTWEHQALVRARVIAGDPVLCEEYSRLRQEILGLQREQQKLCNDVIEMRAKMREQLGSDKRGDDSKAFHLKQDPGGIVDIEFMVQYAVLLWASKAPELMKYTDNIRILENLENSGLLGTQEVQELTEAYKAFRSIGHRLTLQQQSSLIDGKTLAKERQTVREIWQKFMQSP